MFAEIFKVYLTSVLNPKIDNELKTSDLTYVLYNHLPEIESRNRLSFIAEFIELMPKNYAELDKLSFEKLFYQNITKLSPSSFRIFIEHFYNLYQDLKSGKDVVKIKQMFSNVEFIIDLRNLEEIYTKRLKNAYLSGDIPKLKSYFKALEGVFIKIAEINFSKNYSSESLNILFKKINSYKKNYIKEVLTEILFKDTTKNLKLNFESLSIFYDYYKDRLFPFEVQKFEILKNAFNLIKLSNTHDEKITSQIKELITSDYDGSETIYYLFSRAKQILANDYLRSSTDISSFDYELKNGVKIIHVNKPFKMFVSVTTCEKTWKNPSLGERHYDMVSTSFVSDRSLGTFRELKRYVTFGFTDFAPSLLYHATKSDNYCTYTFGKTSGMPLVPCDFLPPDVMLEQCRIGKLYNEFNLLSYRNPEEVKEKMGKEFIEKIDKLTPSCIFTTEEPSSLELKLAKKMNIPIFCCKTLTAENNCSFTLPPLGYDR